MIDTTVGLSDVALLERAGYMAKQDEPKQSPPTSPQPFERWLIVTLNPDHSGRVFGVQINNGIGVLDLTAINPKLGWKIADIVGELKNWKGYTIIPLEGKDVTAAIEEVRAKQAEAEVRAAETIRALAGLGMDKIREILESVRST